MNKIIAFAQKGLILDKTKSKLLTIRYGSAKYTSEKVSGKLALPGGKLDFGETPDESFIREVKEETGVTIIPGNPLHIYSWTYTKDEDQVQIVALARIGFYKSGKLLSTSKEEKETIIESVQWVNLSDLNPENFIIDERPVIEKFMKITAN